MTHRRHAAGRIRRESRCLARGSERSRPDEAGRSRADRRRTPRRDASALGRASWNVASFARCGEERRRAGAQLRGPSRRSALATDLMRKRQITNALLQCAHECTEVARRAQEGLISRSVVATRDNRSAPSSTRAATPYQSIPGGLLGRPILPQPPYSRRRITISPPFLSTAIPSAASRKRINDSGSSASKTPLNWRACTAAPSTRICGSRL